MEQAKTTACEFVDARMPEVSNWTRTVWDFGETAWREYKSCAFYVDLLRREGFTVEEGSGGMPTAFCATWDNGDGPTIGGYAEYDGIPGNCQAAEPVKKPRGGLGPHAGGHTDPHSALGMGSLAGFLATKAAMERFNIPGRLKFFGEPAEKVRGSKPIHAAAGYYDDLDAALSFHPFYMAPLCNTVRWDTHCGVGYGVIYEFTCDSPETWMAGGTDSPIPASHAAARAPGATDAMVMMYQSAKALREHVMAPGQSWSMNETIISHGQATADNIPAQIAQIQYFIRISEIEEAEHVIRGLDHFAENAARMNHCAWKRHWVAKSRPGLANHALSAATYANLEAVGAPSWGDEAKAFGRAIQAELGLTPMDGPFLPMISELTPPEQAETALRQMLPPTQRHFTSDDYTEFCWHAPTVRLYIGRPALAAPEGFSYPAWAMNALGGHSASIDPMVETAAKVIAMTALDLLGDTGVLEAAQAEFKERTGGGIGGENWIAPLCDYEPPLQFRWPEYVTTARGEDWVIPRN
ncbi:amidohydrolase [Shimia thalassica]|uniref:amidohydrolase n=1 Tax=Shimia thalassica TaxID=1715693 RepID=UPI001C09118E|nr:amidohydrolase [Shimia thalassica]MBU2942129.1 amidohydrolase [Shimia thalassica]MDO6502902.1 amidohydrolase [Shimia thalassica]